jgi:uncharacterized protein (DUF885 family)
MALLGPPRLLMVAARSVLSSPKEAEDYLERLRRSGQLIDQHSERLRIGAAGAASSWRLLAEKNQRPTIGIRRSGVTG